MEVASAPMKFLGGKHSSVQAFDRSITVVSTVCVAIVLSLGIMHTSGRHVTVMNALLFSLCSLSMILVSLWLSGWSVTRSAGAILTQRFMEIPQNWSEHTVRSYFETTTWLGVIGCSFASTGDLFSSILVGTLTGVLVVLFSQSMCVYLGSGDWLIRMCCGAHSRSGARPHVAEISLPMSFGANIAVIYTFSWMEYTLMKTIFRSSSVILGIALATASGIILVISSDFLARWGPTRHAGLVMQQRIGHAPYNWIRHPLRSFLETSVWIGAIFATYQINANVMPAMQAGSVVGIVVVLMGHALSGDVLPKSITRAPLAIHSSYRVSEPDVLSAAESDGELRFVQSHDIPNAVFTMEEVAKHSTETDLWLIVHDLVYDVSKWAVRHPGGLETIVRFAGRDATDEMIQMHPKRVLDTLLHRFCIGRVVDVPAPTPIQSDFRKLYQRLVDEGLFLPSASYYAIKAVWLGSLMTTVWVLVCCFSNAWLHLIAALVLALFWQQISFMGHDSGHMSVTADRRRDYDIALLVANMSQGVSAAWWKSTHNVHHSVPNSVDHDPDIHHLPALAVSDQFFDSPYSTYHKRKLEFTEFAQKVMVRHQHLLYYPIMAVARFNLYAQSWIRLLTAPVVERRAAEFAALLVFITWYSFLVSRVEGAWLRFAFVMISNAFVGVLHVQITLSHFAQPVVRGIGGDFYSRNITASLDVDCPKWLDWFHGGLQFQTIHHCFPRLCRFNLRHAQPLVRDLALKHGLPYQAFSFMDANRHVISHLKETALKTHTWSPKIWESVNLEG